MSFLSQRNRRAIPVIKSNALKAMILIPMSLLGYVLHPLAIRLVKDQVLISLVMMVALSVFAFVNLWIINQMRRKGGKE